MKPSRSKFPCELCNKTFFTKAYLKYHISAYHKDPLNNSEDPSRIPCPLCPKTFTRYGFTLNVTNNDFLQKFHQKFENFHEKFTTAFDFGSYFCIKLQIPKQNYFENEG